MKGALAVIMGSRMSSPTIRVPSTSVCSSSDVRSSHSSRAPLVPLFDRYPARRDARPRDRDGADRQRRRGRMPRQPERNRHRDGESGAQRASVAGRERDPPGGRGARPLADLPVRDVIIDGLTFREVVSVTTIAGGVAANVVPDHVEAGVNYRYAPGHAPAEAESRLRELLLPRASESASTGTRPRGGERAQPAGDASPRGRRSAATAQAGVDTGRGVRPGRRRRRQLRPR